METYVIVPHKGGYRLMAIADGNDRRLVAVFSTEKAAVARLRALQKQAEPQVIPKQLFG